MKVALALTTTAAMLFALTVSVALAQTDYDNGYYRGLDDNRISPSQPPEQASPGYQQGYDAGAQLGTMEREDDDDYQPPSYRTIEPDSASGAEPDSASGADEIAPED